MKIEQFRNGINYLANREGYTPVVQECIGVANIISGIAQIIIGNLMKCSKEAKYHTLQSEKHIRRGIKTLVVGIPQIMPAVCTSCAIYYFASKWCNIKI